MKFVRVSIAIVGSLIGTLSVCAMDREDLVAALDQVLDTDVTARRTTVSLKVVDLESGDVLYDRFGDRLFTPASNLKIYTSACALDLFGPEHSFPTRIVGRVDDGEQAVVGDVTIVGGGNAMLSTADLRLLAVRVANDWNVRHVHGQVVVDNSRYSDVRLGPGWMWDDQPYYFNMRVTPLMVDFNVQKLPGKFDADGDPVRRAVTNPEDWIASELSAMLRQHGVEFETSEAQGTSGKQRTITYDGTPLHETLRHFNHVSENAVGEVLLHEIAIAKGVKRPTWADGSKLITTWLLEKAGLAKGSFRLDDGSGLSRYNLISADSSTNLLAFMRQHKHYQVFFKALPAYQVKTASGESQYLVRAKSGGMSGVSTISGYLQTLQGRQLAFSLLANGFIGSNRPVRELRGKVWAALAQFEPAK
ncbi:MAG: D-alanyl-D-alanine carboxypeptidase [Planctomycetota bacterium]